jgi:hypothetical protein
MLFNYLLHCRGPFLASIANLFLVRMKFFGFLVPLGMVATAVGAAYPNPGNGQPDACYTGMLNC